MVLSVPKIEIDKILLFNKFIQILNLMILKTMTKIKELELILGNLDPNYQFQAKSIY